MSGIRILISYSHENSEWLNDKDPRCLLDFWKRSLRHENVEFWFDRDEDQGIRGSDRWRHKIFAEIDRADIAILLITQDFVISPFIRDEELPYILERAKQGEMEILPILVEPAKWKELDIHGMFQMTPGQPTPLCAYYDKSTTAWKEAKIEVLDSLESAVKKVKTHRKEAIAEQNVLVSVKEQPTEAPPRLPLVSTQPPIAPASGPTVAIKAEQEAKTKAAADAARQNTGIPVMVPIPGKNYELGKYPVTQRQWIDVMGSNPSFFSGTSDADLDRPVESVSWNDVQEFLQNLNAKTGKQYRLPTEDEWEYACYGGSKTEYCGSNDLDVVGWYGGNSGNKTHPVGQKQVNGYGLYDMSGNVWEWMENKYDNEHDWRVLRGGSWNINAQLARAAYRYLSVPAYRYDNYGFRLARTLP